MAIAPVPDAVADSPAPIGGVDLGAFVSDGRPALDGGVGLVDVLVPVVGGLPVLELAGGVGLAAALVPVGDGLPDSERGGVGSGPRVPLAVVPSLLIFVV
ncbi:hypothetical protein GCM10010109_49880 [Actinoplanes campanulatus]|nr:hypothetical protein GCM10010109_49880 [Actinoplanes campanulatus]GID37175.1 hypothetical protein Aca09nite_36810 [Actinoplanes campanulatus]